MSAGCNGLFTKLRFSDYLFVQEDFKNEEVINFMNTINEDLIIYLTATVRPLVSYLKPKYLFIIVHAIHIYYNDFIIMLFKSHQERALVNDI